MPPEYDMYDEASQPVDTGIPDEPCPVKGVSYVPHE